jgi:serine/threonine protein kinase
MADFSPAIAQPEILKAGHGVNASVSVLSIGTEKTVIKDFRGASWLVRHTVGRFLIHRELHSLRRLHGLAGVPAVPVRIGPFALSYQFVAGETLSALRARGVVLEAEFFSALEQLVVELHARGFVHLDLRNGKNILRTETGQPHLVDFQSGLWTRWLPAGVRRGLQAVDCSGVYKWWHRLSPQTLDARKVELLRTINRQRRLWRFNYPRQDERLRE